MGYKIGVDQFADAIPRMTEKARNTINVYLYRPVYTHKFNS